MKKIALALLLLAIPLVTHAATLRTGEEHISLPSLTTGDAFLVGQDVMVDQVVSGELVVAGKNITVKTAPTRSMVIAGQTVVVSGGSGYNTIIAGDTVTLSGTYAHDVYVMASHLILEPETHINGTLEAAVSGATLAGTIDGSVVINGISVTSTAAIAGNVNGDISLLTFEGGSIGGNLTYASQTDATNLSKVSIKGTTSRTTPQRSGGFGLVELLSSLLFIAFVVIVTPRHAREIFSAVKDGWGRNWVIGFCTLIFMPLLAALFMATLIGWKVALLLMGFYALVMLIAGAYGAIVVGEWVLQAGNVKFTLPSLIQRTILVGFLGALILAILGSVPLVAFIVAVVFGVGVVVPVLGSVVSNLIREQK
jgi:hypothetical protein